MQSHVIVVYQVSVKSKWDFNKENASYILNLNRIKWSTNQAEAKQDLT